VDTRPLSCAEIVLISNWISEHQWRLSFSRAEIVLLNSWTPVQQIVYHVLRVFMKTEGLMESVDNGSCALSNYHIKTSMLWACELKPRNWWTDNSLVRICVKLLNHLGASITNAQCPHYFIIHCNLLDSSFNWENIRSRLLSVNIARFSRWFIHKYVKNVLRFYHITFVFYWVTTMRYYADVW